MLLGLVVLPCTGRGADHRLAVYGGAGAWPHPDAGWHGYIGAAWDVDDLFAGAHLGVEYNTETLRLELDRLPVAGDWLTAGVRLTGEARYAGLLMDHYLDGKNELGRGFSASYLHAEAHLKAALPGDHYLELAAGVRRWFFSTLDETAPALRLPPDSWVFEPRLRYTYWRLDADPGWSERHRLFPRVRGLAAGVELGLDWRSQARAWGALDPAAFDPVDVRNDPDRLILSARQWLRWGWQAHDRIRVQLAEFASHGRGEDDLTRVRLGGLNPYVVSIAGLPWAGLLADTFIALENSYHYRFYNRMELGLLFQAALVEDVPRRGLKDTYEPLVGFGIFFDLRFWDFQLDLRAGWSPTHNQVAAGQGFGLFIAFGWQYD